MFSFPLGFQTMLYLSALVQTFQTCWGAQIHSPIKAVSSRSLINIARRFVLWDALKRGVARPELCILRFPKATLNLPVPSTWSKSHGEEIFLTLIQKSRGGEVRRANGRIIEFWIPERKPCVGQPLKAWCPQVQETWVETQALLLTGESLNFLEALFRLG